MRENKSLILCCIIIFSLMILPFVLEYLPKYDRQKIANFDPFREDFNMITEYLIEMLDEDYDEYITVGNERDDFTYLEHSSLGRIDLPSEISEAFSRVSSTFRYPERKIHYTAEKVAIGGHHEAYVYSRKNGIPSHFSFPKFSLHESVYILKEDWYLFTMTTY